MYCSNCGSLLKEKVNFCENCGNKINNNIQNINNLNNEYNFDTLDYGKAKIIINKNTITISRSGLMAKLKYGHTGNRTIFINQISAVEVKEAKFTMGHIQFILAGTTAKKQPLYAKQKDRCDENTIMFSKKENNIDAQEIKKYIENYILNN